jgi:DNA-binding CsgD family transcriptional regulator
MRLIIGLLFVLVSIAYGYSNSYRPNTTNIFYTTQGASRQNWGVDCDTNGFMYFANNKGLLEFDGSRWKLYPLPNRITIRSVKVDRKKGLIYTGAYHEFGYWQRAENGELVYTSLSKNLPNDAFHNDEIWRIVFQGKRIYFQSFSTIFIYENDSIQKLIPPSKLVFLLKANERIFVQFENIGLHELIDNSLKLIPGGELFANGLVRTMLCFENDKFLIGSGTEGLFIYDGNEIKKWDAPVQDKIKKAQINTGLFDGKYYYVGTIMNGVYIFDSKGILIRNFSADNNLQNNTVLGISEDNEGNIWLGLDRGIDVIKNESDFFVVKSEKNILGSIYSAALFNDNIYIATNLGVYYQPFSSDDIFCLGMDKFRPVEGIQGQTWNLSVFDNQLLCGNNEGSYRIEDNKSFKISNISGGYNFKNVRFNNHDYLLQSTYYHLLIYENQSNRWQVKNTFTELNEPFTEIEAGAERYIWASHPLKGVYRIHLNERLDKIESVNSYSTNKGLPTIYNNGVTKIGNRIAFSTSLGIYTYDDLYDTIVPYNKIKKTLGDYFYSQKIISTGKDNYWFVKDNVIALFNINLDSVRFIASHDFNYTDVALVEQYENILAINDTMSLICFENGFGVTYNHERKEYYDNSRIILTNAQYNILNNDSKILLGRNKDNIELPFDKNEIEFFYTLTNQNKKDVLYQYKLIGYNNSWSQFIQVPYTKYSQLPWGEYTFVVRAFINDKYWSSETSYSFVIKTPWYYTFYAIAIYIIASVSLISLTVFLVLQYYRRKKEVEKKFYEDDCIRKQDEERIRIEHEMTELRNDNLNNELSHKSKELAISTMSIIKKNEVLLHIKEELNKQKEELGVRYPQKFYQVLNSIIDSNISQSDEWEIFEINFNQTHNNFFQRLKCLYPDLTPSDLRLCAFLRLNLTSKEIAPLLGISLRGIETHRYRLRKKFDLASDDNLIEFILKY